MDPQAAKTYRPGGTPLDPVRRHSHSALQDTIVQPELPSVLYALPALTATATQTHSHNSASLDDTRHSLVQLKIAPNVQPVRLATSTVPRRAVNGEPSRKSIQESALT